jgi:pimeloyl-ACP methyl ester carboxylesterase
MTNSGFKRLLRAVLSSGALLLVAGCASIERRLLFYPSHRPPNPSLAPWTEDGKVIGYSRVVDSPENIWLMIHGNAGQATDRVYAIHCFSPRDSVYILEYPGYGGRKGMPSRESLDRAAADAYLLLRNTFPRLPICVVGESIGTGPASSLAALDRPPDKFVLVVPFDRLKAVAADHFPSFLVGLVMTDDWDNVSALSHYRGPVDIIGAENDTVIPIRHARALAAAIPTSKFWLIEGGHNDWSYDGRVQIRNP